ncbi:MAG TPA: RNA methyltransferase [Nitrospiria bacterium]|nr:RNA methyltransferase [Nitrospiria bacterium]
MSDPLKNISIVLVRPTRPGNIGAAARAIKNMGLSRLVLVRPVDPLSSDSYTMAYGAHDILESAKIFQSLPRALARCRYVVGTTARTHKGYGKPAPLMKTVPDILARAKRHPVAVLFGPESSGLANDEIALCQSLMAIPTAAAHTSINLAQAVMVVAYELRRCAETDGGKKPGGAGRRREIVDTDQRERFYQELKTLLEMIGFVKGTQGKHIQADLRRIFGRAEPDERELRILRGIVRQVRWALTHR